MSSSSHIAPAPLWAALELLKPVTWFPPMWAFACGVVSSGVAAGDRWLMIAAGILLAGPFLCGSSQVVNDWFDRDVDAINEPHRPIPSGRISVRLGWQLAVAWSALSLALASLLGTTVFAAAALGLVLAWAYSAPPVRLKQNGWWGNAACALSYEGLAWITGAAVMTGGQLTLPTVTLAALYSLGAHGIMTLNDFKSVVGDRQSGVASLPVQLGVATAARVACLLMAASQVLVIACLLIWDRAGYALAIGVLVAVQVACMRHLLAAPAARAPWYNATGVGLFVTGMMISAFAIGTL